MSKHGDHRVDRIDVDVAIDVLKSTTDQEGITSCLKVAHLLEHIRDSRPDLVRSSIK
jgi:hypothetical protein